MSSRRLDLVLVFLVAATVFTWWLGKSGAAGVSSMLLMLGAAAIKGTLIALDFMALRGVKFIWPAVVVGWLLVVLAIIVGTYLVTGSSA